MNMLILIKTLHTIIWLLMVSAIVYLLYTGITYQFNTYVIIAAGLVAAEGLVLMLNKGICPITNWALKYVKKYSFGFDTFVPTIIIRYHRTVLGIIYFIALSIHIYNLYFRL